MSNKIARPHPSPLLQERETNIAYSGKSSIARLVFAFNPLPAQRDLACSTAENDSPSPGGESWGEVEQLLTWSKKLILVLTSILSLTLPSAAADWPRWGGNDPGRNMFSTEKNLPDHFVAGTNRIDFKAGTQDPDLSNVPNAKWVAKLGSQ